MDKLSAMRTFVTIVDQGSLTAAAERLDRSLPTMVRVLAALEEDLGVRLLRRSTRRMSLTPEGRGYLARCRQILADVEDADQSVARGQTVPRGKIRMTAPVLFGQRHVAPGLIDFAHRFDEVEVELLLLDRVINLIEEGIDVAVRIAHLADSSMIAVPVGHMRRVVCASPALLARQGTPAHPHELANFECVHFSGINPGESWNFLENGVGFSVRIQKNFTCNQAVAAAEACAKELGFGNFLFYQVEPLIHAGRLQVVFEKFELPAIPINLVYPEARLMTARLRILLDWLKQSLPASFRNETDKIFPARNDRGEP